jgi:hypothetical protein
MARESKRVLSEAGAAMHSRIKIERSLAGEVLRQAPRKKVKRKAAARKNLRKSGR